MDTVYLIVFTSGTSGLPKGAKISHKNIVSSVSAGSFIGFHFDESDVYCSYVPLTHIMEQVDVALCLHFGCQIGFPRFSGNFQQAIDPEMLMEDLKELRPTSVGSFPLFFNKIYQKTLDALSKQGSMTRAMFN